MKVNLFLVVAICLCLCGCSEERLLQPLGPVFFGDSEGHLSHPVEMAFFGDGDTKYIDAGGVTIVGHSQVADVHFYKARMVFLIMTSEHPEIREYLSLARDFRIVLLDARGEGGCGWNFCRVSSDTFTLVHEFGHAMHYAIRELDPAFQERLEEAYAVAYADAVEDAGYWNGPDVYRQGDYAMRNDREYWAMGVNRWFGLTTYFRDGVWPYFQDGQTHFRSGELSYDAYIAQDHDVFLELDPMLYALLKEWLPPPVDLRDIDWQDRLDRLAEFL